MKRSIKLIVLFFLFFSLTEAGQDDWQIAKATHFIVHYKNVPSDFIDKLISKAEDYYNRIADDLGLRRFDFWLWDRRAKVYIYDNQSQYQRATGQPQWSSGCALPKEKIIQTFPYAQGFFETILPHEMGHIIFREFVGFNNTSIPLWLEEGVASYQEKLKYLMLKSLLREAMSEGTFMDLEALSNFDTHYASDDNLVLLFYAEAFGIVDFLIREFGRDNFVLFCQALRDKQDLERSIASSYPFSNLGELDEAWQRNLKK